MPNQSLTAVFPAAASATTAAAAAAAAASAAASAAAMTYGALWLPSGTRSCSSILRRVSDTSAL